MDHGNTSTSAVDMSESFRLCYETFSVSIFWNTLAREMAKVLYSQTYYDPYLLTRRSPANLQSDAPQKTMSSYFFYVRMQRARPISRRGKTGLKNRQKSTQKYGMGYNRFDCSRAHSQWRLKH